MGLLTPFIPNGFGGFDHSVGVKVMAKVLRDGDAFRCQQFYDLACAHQSKFFVGSSADLVLAGVTLIAPTVNLDATSDLTN